MQGKIQSCSISLAIRSLACVIAAMLLCIPLAYAKKPDISGGGEGGGGGTSSPYRFVDLGGFTGGDLVQSRARGVNNPDDNGLLQVVGDSHEPVPGSRSSHAAIWDVTDDGLVVDLIDIHPLDYEESTAEEVNDFGHAVVGDYVWVNGQGLVTLPGLGGGDTDPGLLNDLGDIIGTAFDASGVRHLASWHISQSGTITGPVDLGPEVNLPPYFNAFDMNNHGVMAGFIGYEAAIMWFDADGKFQFQLLGIGGEAVAINDNGVVIGNGPNPNGQQRAFKWSPETGVVWLGTLGGNESYAAEINNQGQIVGWSDSSGRFSQVAFLWQGGQMFDLNQITDGAGGKNWLQRAYGINDAGHIVGEVRLTKPASENHGFLLVPNAMVP